MTIYIDAEYKCHAAYSEGLTAVDVPYFDGQDEEVIEAYRFVPAGCEWTRGDGETFKGEMLAPCKEISFGTTADEYNQMKREIADMRAALNNLGVYADE